MTGSLLALGIACTAVAYILYFGLIAGAGASKAILVTYLVPPIAILYGVLLLGEDLRPAMLVGLVLILGGVGLGTGNLRLAGPPPRSRRRSRAEPGPVTRGYVVSISVLAGIWGASYLFIKVAVDDVEPAPMMFFRVALAALLLVPFVLVTRGTRQRPRRAALRGEARLRARDDQRRDPVHADRAGREVHRLRRRGRRERHRAALRRRCSRSASGRASAPAGAASLGILLGLAGVALLAGAQPGGGWATVGGTMLVVLASLSYASGALYGQTRSHQIAGPVLAAATVVVGRDRAAPLAVIQAPHAMPSWEAIASIVALGVAGTALAQLILFRMFRLYGASRTTLVTYLMPPTALLYGMLFLDEPLTLASVGGLAVILAGVGLGSGAPAPAAPRAGALRAARVSVSIRRAQPDDVDFLVELFGHEEVEPFLSRRPRARPREPARRDRALRGRAAGLRPLHRSRRRQRAGAMGFEVANRRSRIANLGGLAIHPDFRGRRIADEAARQFRRALMEELGYHRLQLEIYGFNERAIAHAERVGFVREGVRRKAYWRHGEWVDSVLFGLVEEDLPTS